MFAAGAEGPGGPRHIREMMKNTERRQRTDRQMEGEREGVKEESDHMGEQILKERTESPGGFAGATKAYIVLTWCVVL